MYRWTGTKYQDDGIRNAIVLEMGYRNKTVIEYYVDDKGDYEEKNIYRVIDTIFSEEGETLLTKNLKDEKRVFVVERAKNKSKRIISVKNANDDTCKYADNFW